MNGSVAALEAVIAYLNREVAAGRLTPKEIGEKIGKDQGTVSKYLAGKVKKIDPRVVDALVANYPQALSQAGAPAGPPLFTRGVFAFTYQDAAGTPQSAELVARRPKAPRKR